MKSYLVLIYLLTISSHSFCQNKIEEFVGLKPINTYTEKEYVRISTPGRFINIHQDSSGKYSGEVIYVVQWENRGKTDTLFENYIVSAELSEKCFKVFDNYQIDSLKDDKFYYKNLRFLDGYPIQIERTKNSFYYLKEYNTPDVTDTIKDRVLIASFMDTLNKLLDLESKEKDFKQSWPLIGSFNSFSGIYTARIRGGYQLGYRFESYSPYGVYFSKYFTASKHKYIQTSVSAYYNTNLKTNYNYGIGISKTFRLKLDTIKEISLSINYRNRNIQNKFNRVGNLTINSWYKHLTFGIDFKENSSIKTGAFLGYNSVISFLKTSAFVQASVFDNNIDYSLSLSKVIRIDYLRHNFVISIKCENFQKENCINGLWGIYL